MAIGSDNSDGSDTFWPGYVDAVTNLVLNLLFLLTIMIVAVFMFALELGRASKGGADKSLSSSSKTGDLVVAVGKLDPVKENAELKREIERLNLLLAQRVSSSEQIGNLVKTVEAKTSEPKPLNGLDQSLASESEITVLFKDEAVAFTPNEHEQMIATLKPIVEIGHTIIYVEVPAGFSEAKRMGFYRAMAVRNLLIEMQMPKENINVSVIELKNSGNASLVRVRPYR